MEMMYSVDSAAKALGGISPMTIRAWLRTGRLRRTKVGSRTMIRESALREMVKDEPALNYSDHPAVA